jgi:hypothetical protein
MALQLGRLASLAVLLILGSVVVVEATNDFLGASTLL